MFQTCVLGLPGQVKNFDSESFASHDEMRLLDLFATQTNKSNNIMINLDVCLEFYHDLIVVAYLEWLIN